MKIPLDLPNPGKKCRTEGTLRSGIKLEGQPEKVPVRAHDLCPTVAEWLGASKAQYAHTVRTKLFLLPDDQRDVVKKLTILPHTLIRVIDSPVAAIVLGRPESKRLIERRNEDLGLGSSPGKPEDVDHRIDEMLEAARMAGMSTKGLTRVENMVRENFREMWRTTLGKADVVSVPPLEIKIKGDIFQLPKPYMKRYSPAGIRWWREKMADLVRNGIFRPSNSGQLSHSNLVKKVLHGKVLPDDFQMVVDLRSLNKMIEDLDFPIPKLDEIIHLLQGVQFFTSADNTKGCWQFPLHEASKKYTGFVSPIGTYEHNRVPMGLKVAAAYYQRTMQRILGSLLFVHILQYIDDTLVFARNEDELLDALEK